MDATSLCITYDVTRLIIRIRNSEAKNTSNKNNLKKDNRGDIPARQQHSPLYFPANGLELESVSLTQLSNGG